MSKHTPWQAAVDYYKSHPINEEQILQALRDKRVSLDRVTEETLTELIEGGSTKLLISLAQVDFVSSAGLRVLLATAKKLGGIGGQLRVSDLNDTVNEVFEISGFTTILSVIATEAEALEGF